MSIFANSLLLAALASLEIGTAFAQQSTTAAPDTDRGRTASTKPAPILASDAPVTATARPAEAIPGAQLVKVTIATSRTEVAGTAPYGVFADLENVSPGALRIYSGDIRLVIQPEIAGDHNCNFAVDGYLPTESYTDDQHPRGGDIVIQPKEHYPVFWDVSKSNTKRCGPADDDEVKQGTGPENGAQRASDPAKTPASLASSNVFEKLGGVVADLFAGAQEQLSFVPGDYVFVVAGKAYSAASTTDTYYHTFTDRVKLHVGLSQIDTMIAAMLGGILGYLVIALREGGDFKLLASETASGRRTRGMVTILRSMISAALVSAVVTVILSRISDTQFPIKVSVNDFWGALTVGFVAFFAGNKLIDRIAGLASTPKGNRDDPFDQQGKPASPPKD